MNEDIHKMLLYQIAQHNRNTIEYFNKNRYDFIISEWLFDQQKLITPWLPSSESSGKFAKSLIKKRVIFTSNKCKFNIVWNTENIRSLFQIKDNVNNYSCVIYEGNCSCGEKYVGESVKNVLKFKYTITGIQFDNLNGNFLCYCF